MTNQQTVTEPRKIGIQPHRLGMGWHHIWEYDPPIEHRVVRPDGTPYYWWDTGETSEGCIMWLADCFATQHLKTTAREIYREAYRQQDDEEFEDDWVATDALRDAWSKHTVIPKKWHPSQVRKLFEDLEDVNYHSFLAKLIELVEQRLPELAAKLNSWCKPAPMPLFPVGSYPFNARCQIYRPIDEIRSRFGDGAIGRGEPRKVTQTKPPPDR